MNSNIDIKLAAYKYLGLTNIIPSLEQVFKTRLEAAGYKVTLPTGFGITEYDGAKFLEETKPNYDNADPSKVFISITVEDIGGQEYHIDWISPGFNVGNFLVSATMPDEDDNDDEMYGEREWENDTEMETSLKSGYKFWDAHIEELINVLDTAN